MYKQLMELNEKFIFYSDIKSFYELHEVCTSKKIFDQIDITDMLKQKLFKEFNFFEEVINKINHNIDKYDEYLILYKNLTSTFTPLEAKKHNIFFELFVDIERELYKKNIAKPIMNTEIKCLITYTSPQGRNHYEKSNRYPFIEIKNNFNEILKDINEKSTLKYQIKIERSKMTDSMRHDVLRRDNSTCKMCGISVSDGAKMHVDHIYPVSKGGTTTLDNLQTLCSRCNIGKRDKV